MEASLLQLEKESTDEESINSLFRAVHTIKGSSGMFGFEEIEKFTHIVENLLDDVRKGVVEVDEDLMAILLDSHDYIQKLVDLFERSKDSKLDDGMVEKNIHLTRVLNSYLSSEKAVKIAEIRKTDIKAAPTGEAQVINECWHISMRFKENTFKDSLDPMTFVSYLRDIGEIVHIVTIGDRLPVMEEFDPENCYLGLEIDFKGKTSKDDLEKVFEFLIDDCTLRILPPQSKIQEYVDLIRGLPEDPEMIGEILVRIGSLTQAELDTALNMQINVKVAEGEKDGKRLGEIVVDEKMLQETVVNAAIEKQNQIRRDRRSIRVDPEKLDTLINFVGELVITGANVKQHAQNIGDPDLLDSVSQMSRLIEYIRDSAMNVRMVQIGDVFRKFERVVRDLSRERGKDISLVIIGGETELDKTLVEKINDPLMHLIRNSADHGIDTPAERLKRGKPARGTITLNAYHGTGSIIIEVMDDGDGLNKTKILKKAIDKGFVSHGQEISDNELLQFIFEPGFSTAEVVTNISGRGVGMDVVKRNIQSLRGSIALESAEGVGTTVKIHLPLTLAIIDGFMVVVGDSYYIFPLDMVIECAEITKNDIQGKDAYNFINLRGEILPFMRLRDFFGEKGAEQDIENIVVVEYSQRKVAIVVDRLIGESQTVIKPL
ncbi:MAG: chemotaxis protein CheA, partial [Spirochaetes bacterium]|nr:chemotaxis protein CheA [Spirochaetota bacterium]